jgi:glycosyltransferase involved in cell wall biosynthesis
MRLIVVDDGVGLWGAQRAILRIAPYLHSDGYEIALLAPAGSALSEAWPDLVGGDVLSLAGFDLTARSSTGGISPIPLLQTASRLAQRSFSIARASRAFNASVVVANSFWTHFDTAAAGRISGVPTVLYLHEEVHRGIPSAAAGVAIRLSQGAIAVSADVAASAGGSRRITVVNNGVDATIFSPGPALPSLRAELTEHPEHPLIVTVCRLDEVKQVDHVIRAVHALTGNLASTGLAVIGNTTTDHAYFEMVRELGDRLLGNRIRFLGSREDIPDILRTADLYVLAGRLEGMPLGILEAQATGCPVVAYPAAGVRDAIVDGESGVIAEMNDWTSLATSISSVLVDDGFRNRLVENARKSIDSKYSLLHQAEQFASVMESVVATRAGGRSRSLSLRDRWASGSSK